MNVYSSTQNLSSFFDYTNRAEELNKKIQEFKQKLQINSNISLSFVDLKSLGSTNLLSKTIKIPSWMLLKHEDIPSRFLINDVNDPRLTDRQFLNEFVTWISEKLKDPSLSTSLSSMGPLQNLLLLLRDQNLFEKSKDFTLCHELGHISYYEKRSLPIGMIALGLLAIVLSLALIPIINLTVGLIGIGIAVVITYLGISRLPSLSNIEQEKKADLDAVAVLDDAAGGIYDFETHLMFNRRVRLQGGEHLLSFDEKGNFLDDKEHPPLSERVAYLRQWQEDRNKANERVTVITVSNPQIAQHYFCKV